MPGNVHLIVASRDRFLPAAETVRLGGKVYQVGTEQLRLNHTELAVYAHRCGVELSDTQVESLLYFSEGWFSAVYLNLRTFSEHGVLPSHNSDIYATFTAAMIDPLPERQQEFLAVMGLADEFTAEMARFITGDANAEKLLAILTEQNAFVKCLPDGVTYRFHHMMKEYSERCFLTMKAETQRNSTGSGLVSGMKNIGSIFMPSPLTGKVKTTMRCCGSFGTMRVFCWRR